MPCIANTTDKQIDIRAYTNKQQVRQTDNKSGRQTNRQMNRTRQTDRSCTVCLVYFRKGSVIVDFSLTQHVYDDTKTPTEETMREILMEELEKGMLGNFKASKEKFEFSEVNEGKYY